MDERDALYMDEDVVKVIEPRTANFDKVFHEPKDYLNKGFSQYMGNHIIRGCYGKMYTYTQLGMYYIISVIIGCPLSIIYGAVFGLVQVVSVWVVNPWMELFIWPLHILQRFYIVFIRTLLDPLMFSVGRGFGWARLRVDLRRVEQGEGVV